jgi:pilus assembly protein Flp/PilA
VWFVEVQFSVFQGAIAMKKFVKNLIRREEGATMVEYGLVAALIAVVALGAVTAVGTSVTAIFNQIATALAGA